MLGKVKWLEWLEWIVFHFCVLQCACFRLFLLFTIPPSYGKHIGQVIPDFNRMLVELFFSNRSNLSVRPKFQIVSLGSLGKSSGVHTDYWNF